MRIDIQQMCQREKGGGERRAGFNQPLLFILVLDVGAQGVDGSAHAILLQVAGLIEERLGQFHARFIGADVSRRAQASQILRHH